MSFSMDSFINYLKGTKEELKHVAWPTQRQTVVYTALVVGISIVVALFLGFFDFVFSRGIDWFLK